MPANSNNKPIYKPELASVGEFSNVPLQKAIEPRQKLLPVKKSIKKDFDFDIQESGNRGIGCGSIFRLIKTLGCGCFALVIFFIIALIVLVVVRPPNFWEPAKQWINVNLTHNEDVDPTAAEVYTQLSDQLKTFVIGKNTLVITEQQIKVIALDKVDLFQLDKLNVQVSEENIKFYWNVEVGAKVPLWFVVEAKPAGGGLISVNKIGFERVSFPAFLNDFLLNGVTSGAKITQGNDQANLINLFLEFPKNVQVESLQTRENELLINLNITTGLSDFELQN